MEHLAWMDHPDLLEVKDLLDTRDLLVLLVYLDREECLDL